MTALAALALAAAAAIGASAGEVPREAPVLSGSGSAFAVSAAPRELVIFKGTLLLNEFVYRAVLKLPADAQATPQTARSIAVTLAGFLGDAGYDLAKVRAQVVGDQIEVQIDEGALDKIIVVGTGWLGALRFRAALNLPLDVFNRRVFDLQMPKLARRFGLRGYRFELLPVHLVDTDNALKLDEVEELRAVPMMRAARGYELRIFAETEKWGTGFSPEIILNGRIGTGLGGRYRWKDLLQEGDRWQAHFRVGGALRSSIEPGGSSRLVNTNDYFTLRWLSKSWGGTSRGLRMTVSPRAELWSLQRKDLMVENYRISTLELGSGAGAQLSEGFGLYFTGGWQRRWIFERQPAKGATLGDDVTRVPRVATRSFLRANSTWSFNPQELRQDLRNDIAVELNAYRPMTANDSGYFKLDVQGRRLFPVGWHEFRAGFHLTGEFGDVAYVDEVPLADHIRIGFALDRYTKRAGTLSLEIRYSLLRDKVKIGVFNDLGVWRHLPRDDAHESREVSGSAGAGLFLFLFDELQIDAFYGAGWSTDGPAQTGLALAIKEAF